jgi:hypothetical protein
VAGLLVIATNACGWVWRALSTASLNALAVLPEAESEIIAVDSKRSARAGQGVSGWEGCKPNRPRTCAFREWEHSKRGLKTSSLAQVEEEKSRDDGARV